MKVMMCFEAVLRLSSGILQQYRVCGRLVEAVDLADHQLCCLQAVLFKCQHNRTLEERSSAVR